MDLGINNDVFDLFVNKWNFFKLPYRYDLTREGIFLRPKGEIIFDAVEISVPQFWSNLEFIKGMMEKFGNSLPQFT